MLSYSVRAASPAVAMIGLLAATSSANVLVVDAFGGGNYTQIQAAVDAAVDGDTILVKSGAYNSFGVIDKELAIVGDAGSYVHILGVIRARNLEAGKTLLLENLNARGVFGYGDSAYGLFLSNIQGCVRVENCTFIGDETPNFGSYVGADGIRIEACNDVVLTRTSGVGGSGGLTQEPGELPSGAGMHAQSSTFAIYDSTLEGGTGSSADPSANLVDGGEGGDGCLASTDSWCFSSGSSMMAGNGGGGGYGAFAFNPTWGGDGGNGLHLEYFSSGVLLDDLLVRGAGGPPGSGPESFDGAPGYARLAQLGENKFTDLPGASRHFISPTPVRENTSAVLTFTGVPGEQVELLISRSAGLRADRNENGVLLLGGPMRIASMGVVPASGTLLVQFPVFALDPGVESTVLYMQARFTDQQGNTVLSGPSSMVILSHLF
jgi:hypothetical protein